MNPNERIFLREFFQQLIDQPLDQNDPRYVPLYQNRRLDTDDPVELLARGVEWTPGQSVQLLSGFRGTGKSTELRRLRERLQGAGYLVVLCDVEDYINLSTPVDVSDFLLALAGAISDGLHEQGLLPSDPGTEGYWERFVNYLTRTKVDISELGGEAAGVSLKMTLKSDPTFRQRLQERLAGHLGSFVADVREFLKQCVTRIKQTHGPGKELVVLVDSVEHIRGTSVNAEAVHTSVETLFAGHADKLYFPSLHLVYTVPPFVKVKYPNLGSLYEPGGIQILPAIKLRGDDDKNRNEAGYAALREAVQKRGDWQKLLSTPERLDRIITVSGGHFRDLLRILAEIARRATALPVDDRTVEDAVNQIRNEFLPIADDDAQWLATIARTHSASLTDVKRLPDFARFLDTHLVLCYRNGHEWYDTHPLIGQHVISQANALPKTTRKRTKK
ncbi:MAG: hypothetical protein H7A46_00255 [Verrucomicrobiales bacterium]|nr:hypothetical protein [Verrucomicrobiales bacterium]